LPEYLHEHRIFADFPDRGPVTGNGRHYDSGRRSFAAAFVALGIKLALTDK